MLEIFAVGSFAFWALIVAELVLLFLFTEYENGIAATISLIAFGAALQFCGGVNVVGALLHNWYMLLPIAAAYVLLGIGWGIFKWRKLVSDRLAQHDELLEKFVREKGLPAGTVDLPAQYRKEWAQWVARTKDDKTGQTVADTPLIRQHKARWMKWTALWPFSVSLYFLKDLVIEVFTAIYKRLATFLQRIADNIYANAKHVKGNLEVPQDQAQEDGSGTYRRAQ